MQNETIVALFVFALVSMVYVGVIFAIIIRRYEANRKAIEMYDKKAKLYNCARFAAGIADGVYVGHPQENNMDFSCEMGIVMSDGVVELGLYEVTNPVLWDDKVKLSNDILRYIAEKRRIHKDILQKGQ